MHIRYDQNQIIWLEQEPGTGILVRLYRINVLKNQVPLNWTKFLSQSSCFIWNFYQNSVQLLSSHNCATQPQSQPNPIYAGGWLALYYIVCSIVQLFGCQWLFLAQPSPLLNQLYICGYSSSSCISLSSSPRSSPSSSPDCSPHSSLNSSSSYRQALVLVTVLASISVPVPTPIPVTDQVPTTILDPVTAPGPISSLSISPSPSPISSPSNSPNSSPSFSPIISSNLSFTPRSSPGPVQPQFSPGPDPVLSQSSPSPILI